MISKSLMEMEKIAHDFVARLLPKIAGADKSAGATTPRGATVIALSGDLGSGKTTFAKSFASALGISPDVVTSPTFVIEKRIDIGKHDHPLHFKKFIHIDAYRLEKPDEIERLGWRETIANPDNLVLIEWPENIGPAMPEKSAHISFKFIDENTREIVFN